MSSTEKAAVRKDGDPAMIAAADTRRTTTPLSVRIAPSGWQLGAIGATAIRLSDILAGPAHLFGAGDTFLWPTPPPPTSPPRTAHAGKRCTRTPRPAHKPLHDWTAETVFYRVTRGLVAPGGLAVVRRRFIRRRRGLGCRARHRRDRDSGRRGAGFWLSAAPIALVAAVFYGQRLLRDNTSTSISPKWGIVNRT